MKTGYDVIFVANASTLFFSVSEDHGNAGMELPSVLVSQVAEVSRISLRMSMECQ